DVLLAVIVAAVGKGGPRHDAGVVGQDVEPTKLLERSVDERRAASSRRHVVAVGERRPSGRTDLVDDGRRRSGVLADSLDRTAEVVDDDPRTPLGEQERIGTTDATSRARDDCDASVEAVTQAAATGASKPRRSPSVPPSMAARSPSGTPTKSDSISFWLARKVP